LRRAQVIVAADINGLVAALCYAPDPDGIELASVELRLPTGAVPVRRGVARITPGTPLPMATPVAVLARSSDGWFAALAARAAQSLPAAALFLHRDSLPQIAANVREQLGSDVALAASVRKRRTQLVRA
jgi:gamma-glutamyltranspeptidase/glutathione hydrolase